MAASPLIARSRGLLRSISLASRPSIKPSFSSCGSERRLISLISRLPMDSSCLVTMLPLHSAIASARLKSELSAESQSWGWVPQGLSMPL